MKKSGKLMLLAIGILLIGIMGSFYLVSGEGGGTPQAIAAIWVPMFSVIIGLILLLVGFFKKD